MLNAWKFQLCGNLAANEVNNICYCVREYPTAVRTARSLSVSRGRASAHTLYPKKKEETFSRISFSIFFYPIQKSHTTFEWRLGQFGRYIACVARGPKFNSRNEFRRRWQRRRRWRTGLFEYRAAAANVVIVIVVIIIWCTCRSQCRC